MTMCFYDLVVGDTIDVKGPFGSFVWSGKATVMYKGMSRPVKEVGMVCGGSGMLTLYIVRIVFDTSTKVSHQSSKF